MAEKEFNTRIVHKHDIQANWEKAAGFTPKQGELIVYDIDENYDYQRIKIGDGITNVNGLPFWDKGIEDKLIESAPNLEADRGEPGYIANRPGYRKINKDVNTTIEVVEVGSYCLLDFSTVNEDFVNNYLTYEELIRDYSRLYDFYYSYDRVVVETGLLRASTLERVGDKIKLLDDINCYTSIGRSALFYIIHNRDLLSEELKEKIPYNGIWLISTESINPQGSQMRNFWFREYRYTKFDPNLIPDNVMFKRDMGEYVTQEEIDGAIADLHAVQYTEQTLTDEEQMQARKNLGLYNSREEFVTLGQIKHAFGGETVDLAGYVIHAGLVLDTTKPLVMELFDNHANITVHLATYYPQGEDYLDMNIYTECSYWYWGNHALLQNDATAWEKLSHYEDKNGYDDAPFVIYSLHNDDMGWHRKLILSSDLEYPGGGGYAVILRSSDKETVYDKIPEEYLPDTLPNPNALTFTGAVNATYDGSEPVSVEIPAGGAVIASESAPENTSVLWIDTSDDEADNLQAVIDTALAQAKASGEFDGDDYVLTEADKQEIAELAAEMVDVPEGGDSALYLVDAQNPNFEEAYAAYEAGKILQMTNLPSNDSYTVNKDNRIDFYTYIQGMTFGNVTFPSRLDFFGLVYSNTTGGYIEAVTGLNSNNICSIAYQPLRGYLTEHQDISGKLDASELPQAINTALEQAKASGEFKGDPGDDYVLTDADKQEIAELTAPLVDVPESGGGTAGEFSYIRAIAPEDAVYLTINEDENGNPLKFTEAYIAVTTARGSDATTTGNYCIGLTDWMSSFNSKGFAYGLKLNADVYSAQAYVRLNGDILETRIMQVLRVASNISSANPLAEGLGAIGQYAYGDANAGSTRFTPANVAVAFENIGSGQTKKHPIVIDGAMHTVTIGVDLATSIKLAAGTILEVWYR